MKTLAWLPAAVLLAGCNNPGFEAVSIRPIYGWVDGCNPVRVSGHGFGDDVKVTIGDRDDAAAQAELASVTFPEKELDKGYFVEGVMPAAVTGTNGYADVVVTTGGQTSVIDDAYYYVACPGLGYTESASPTEGLVGGETITLSGCGLDAAAVQAWVVDATGAPVVPAALPLTSACGTASATFAAPALAKGTYYLLLTDLDGNPLFGGAPDTADTASIAHAISLTYGGAR